MNRIVARPYLPALFWLDAHFPEHHGHKGAKPEQRWPLPDELRIIADKKGLARDVIICDDMRVIQDPANPTRNADLPEYLRVEGVTIAELVEPFLPTHTAVIHTVDTGILILEPR